MNIECIKRWHNMSNYAIKCPSEHNLLSVEQIFTQIPNILSIEEMWWKIYFIKFSPHFVSWWTYVIIDNYHLKFWKKFFDYHLMRWQIPGYRSGVWRSIMKPTLSRWVRCKTHFHLLLKIFLFNEEIYHSCLLITYIVYCLYR